MRRWTIGIVAMCLLGAWGVALAGEAAPPASLDDCLKQVAAYKYGESRKALIDMEGMIRASFGNADQRKAIIGKLAALVAGDTTTDAKRFVCQQLSIIAGPEAVPLAAKLLPDPDLSHSGRTILERVPGPEAAAALRDALGSLKGKLLIGVINTIGQRRDKDSVAAVAKYLGDADAGVASAAATALGKIGGADATKAVADVRGKAPAAVKPAVDNAYLRCADALVAEGKADDATAIYLQMADAKEPKNVRIAALRGLVIANCEKALPLITAALTGDDPEMQAIATSFVRDMKGGTVAKAFVELLPKLKPATQALVITALADSGDAAARPAMLTGVKSEDPAVRAAALRGLAKVGTAEDVALLAKAAAAGPDPDKAPAAESLARLSAQGADDALLKLLEGADVPLRTAIIRTLGVRRTAAATPAVLKAAEDADEGVRVEALKALESLADEKSAAALVKLLVGAKTPNERATAEKTVFTVANKAKDVEARVEPLLAALPAAATEAKCALLRVAGRLGGTKALAAIRTALKDADAQIKDAAIRALASWPDAAVAADLLDLAKTAPQPNQKIIALQSYIRVIGLPSERAADATLKMYKEAMELATRPDEKKLILGGLGQVKHVEALKMAATCLDTPAVANEACVAVVELAKAVAKADKEASKEALTKVLQITKDKRLIGDARNVMNQLK